MASPRSLDNQQGQDERSQFFHPRSLPLQPVSLFSSSTSSPHLMDTGASAYLNSEDATHVFVYLFERGPYIQFLWPSFVRMDLVHATVNVPRLFTLPFSSSYSIATDGLGLKKRKMIPNNDLCSLVLPSSAFPWPLPPGSLAHPRFSPCSPEHEPNSTEPPWVPAHHGKQK